MGLTVTKHPETVTFQQQVEEAKLKLKNAKPEANHDLIEKLHDAWSARRPKFFLKPPPPIEIHALADLHLEAQYRQHGATISPPANMEPWHAAKAYVDLKEWEVDKNPGRPITLRSLSHSSVQSEGSPKNVRFRDIEADMLVYDKRAPTKELR